MNLEDLLIEQIERLDFIRYSNSFGWICVYTGHNLFAGYKVIDNNILLLWVILSPESFRNALEENFEKFDFGKTWALKEITDEDDLPCVFPFIKDAFEYSKTRRKLKMIKQ
jgi:hypothetical protein